MIHKTPRDMWAISYHKTTTPAPIAKKTPGQRLIETVFFKLCCFIKSRGTPIHFVRWSNDCNFQRYDGMIFVWRKKTSIENTAISRGQFLSFKVVSTPWFREKTQCHSNGTGICRLPLVNLDGFSCRANIPFVPLSIWETCGFFKIKSLRICSSQGSPCWNCVSWLDLLIFCDGRTRWCSTIQKRKLVEIPRCSDT